MENLTDDSLMPFGKFKGTPMVDVPAWYLLYLHENKQNSTSETSRKVHAYIEDNLVLLKREHAKSNKNGK